MKLLFPLVFCILCLTNCGPSSKISSVVDRDAIKEPYKNALIVIPYESGPIQDFTTILKEDLQNSFVADAKKVEILLFENARKKTLTLNAKSDIDDRINAAIKMDNKDVIIFFKPTNFQFYNRALQGVVYEVSAVDVKTKREVWKGELSSGTNMGLGGLADKTAKTVYGRLSGEGVL